MTIRKTRLEAAAQSEESMPEKAPLNKIMPTWGWFVVGAICIYLASIAGKALHPDAGLPPNEPPASSNAYLCDLGLYRQHTVDDEVAEADRKGGDKFDEEAARKRIRSIPDDKLDLQRREDLAFTRKTYRDAHSTQEICPGQ
jgi:hypothetical protein